MSTIDPIGIDTTTGQQRRYASGDTVSGGSGSGTVTSVSVVSANGIAGSVATATSTPAITLSTSVTGILKGNGTAISAATSGTDYSAGTSALSTGIVKSTTTTGALTIAVAGDFPTLNQNTTGTAANVTGTVAISNGGSGQTSQQAALNALTGTQSSGKYLRSDGTNSTLATIVAADVPTLNQSTTGSAATLTTPRAIYGNNFDGSAALAQIIASTYGGTGNGFTKFSGPATAEKTFTLPNASATVLTDNAAVTVAQGGTGATTLTGILKGNGTSAVTAVTAPSGAIVGDTDTQTLSSKRVTPRVTTTASSATPTPDSDASDHYTVTALAAGATFGAPTGTPTDGQRLVIRVKDNGTARSLAFNAIYRFSTDLAAPTTTVISKTLYMGFMYNSADSKWDCLAILNNF